MVEAQCEISSTGYPSSKPHNIKRSPPNFPSINLYGILLQDFLCFLEDELEVSAFAAFRASAAFSVQPCEARVKLSLHTYLQGNSTYIHRNVIVLFPPLSHVLWREQICIRDFQARYAQVCSNLSRMSPI